MTDYGKIALEKAEDVEAALHALSKKQGSRNAAGYRSAPFADLTQGSVRVCGVYAVGGAALSAKLSLRFDSAGSGSIHLTVGGIVADSERVSGEQGEVKDVFFLCAPYIGGHAEAALTAQGIDATLLSVTLVVSGGDSYISKSTAVFAAAENKEAGLLLTGTNDQITGYLYDTKKPEFKEPFVIGEGIEADVAALLDGFAVLSRDRLGNLFLYKIGADGAVGERRFFKTASGPFALGTTEKGLLVAEAEEGSIWLTALNDSLLLTAGGSMLRFPYTAAGLQFVKNTIPPVLMLAGGARCFAKYPEADAPEATDSVTLRVAVSIEGV